MEVRITFIFQPVHPLGKATHWILGSVDPRAGLDVVGRENISASAENQTLQVISWKQMDILGIKIHCG
jgi:hypothetical protein